MAEDKREIRWRTVAFVLIGIAMATLLLTWLGVPAKSRTTSELLAWMVLTMLVVGAILAFTTWWSDRKR